MRRLFRWVASHARRRPRITVDVNRLNLKPRTRFAIHPGPVVSRYDEEEHHIGVAALVWLYRLHPGEYVVWDHLRRETRMWSDYIHLFPRTDGKYGRPYHPDDVQEPATCGREAVHDPHEWLHTNVDGPAWLRCLGVAYENPCPELSVHAAHRWSDPDDEESDWQCPGTAELHRRDRG